MKYLLSTILLLASFSSFAQKKVIDHKAYKEWKRINNTIINKSGSHLSYEILPYEGDGFLYLLDNKTNTLDSFARGKDAVFHADGAFLVFKKSPTFQASRKAELDKVKDEKKPKDSLMIYDIASKKLQAIDAVKNIEVIKDSPWIAYTTEDNKLVTLPKKKWIFFTVKETPYTSKGKRTVFYNPVSSVKFSQKDIQSFTVSEKGNYIVSIVHRKDKADSIYLNVYDVAINKLLAIKQNFTAVSKVQIHDTKQEFSFLASADTLKNHAYTLYSFSANTQTLTKLIAPNDSTVGTTLSASENRALYYTKDGKALYFGLAKTPEAEKKDTLLEKEKAKLDVWAWNDPISQTRQLFDKSRREKQTNLAVYHFETQKTSILEDDWTRVRFYPKKQTPYLLAVYTKDYENAIDWNYPGYEDFYRVDAKTGERELIKDKVQFGGNLSPDGQYFQYFDADVLEHKIINLQTKQEQCITCGHKELWQEDFNGMPSIANPVGTVDWTANPGELWIMSRYEPWLYNFEQKTLRSLTDKYATNNRIRITLEEKERDSLYFQVSNYYAKGFYEKDKSAALYNISAKDGFFALDTIIHSPHMLTYLFASDSTETVYIRRGNIEEFPEIYGLKAGALQKLSNTNPQQEEYNWAHVELVKWRSYKGIELEGLLYRPENYDPSKKYPMIVYYYETHSDELHAHSTPRPTASVVLPTEYASAGYFIFMPNISYTEGHPAKSAYDCILSGTDAMLKLYPAIDSTRMGLQGQSWGGYQTAQLITMTTRYKAAMAGAPVANMFSAYGGIRWTSGLTRQFQYEKTQSRIGKTIWEAPELYVENSPLFHLPKVKTPLLIMHNDDDGAVPWYQGIELFAGLRRLQQPVWMLNYNGDGHNLMKPANRIDLSIRMRQFFDHYLLGTDAPRWMTEGIPALEKGKDYKLD